MSQIGVPAGRKEYRVEQGTKDQPREKLRRRRQTQPACDRADCADEQGSAQCINRLGGDHTDVHIIVDLAETDQADRHDQGFGNQRRDRRAILAQGRDHDNIEGHVDDRRGDGSRKACLFKTMGGIDAVDDDSAPHGKQKSRRQDPEGSHGRQIALTG